MSAVLPHASARTQLRLLLCSPGGLATRARVFIFEGLVDGGEHLALAFGDLAEAGACGACGTEPRRWHGCTASASPVTSSAAGGATAARSCGRRSGTWRGRAGSLFYLRQEGRGIGLYAKLDAYGRQDAGLDTYEANVALGFGEDERDDTVAARMLLALGVSRVAC